MTTTQAVAPRNQIAKEHTWNAESVFATQADWETEYKAVMEAILNGKSN